MKQAIVVLRRPLTRSHGVQSPSCMGGIAYIGSVPPGTGPAPHSLCRAGWLAVGSCDALEPVGLCGSLIAAGRLHRTRMVAGTQGSHSQDRVEEDVAT